MSATLPKAHTLAETQKHTLYKGLVWLASSSVAQLAMENSCLLHTHTYTHIYTQANKHQQFPPVPLKGNHYTAETRGKPGRKGIFSSTFPLFPLLSKKKEKTNLH